MVGLKEPSGTGPLRHRHVFFAHAYKGQVGGPEVLRRFVAGGGTLLDLEAMVDDGGRRVVAFGYWAGYAGAALAVLQHRGALDRPLRSTSRDELDARLRGSSGPGRALVIGASGRSGRGALDALRTISDVTCDVTSDANRLPVNDRITTWAEPVRRLHGSPVLDVIAIDNLPSLLPRESSAAFSADLTPYLRVLPDDPVWTRCRTRFDEAVADLDA